MPGFGERLWGLTAGEGPDKIKPLAGARQRRPGPRTYWPLVLPAVAGKGLLPLSGSPARTAAPAHRDRPAGSPGTSWLPGSATSAMALPRVQRPPPPSSCPHSTESTPGARPVPGAHVLPRDKAARQRRAVLSSSSGQGGGTKWLEDDLECKWSLNRSPASSTGRFPRAGGRGVGEGAKRG